jgi:hypothetical protein
MYINESNNKARYKRTDRGKKSARLGRRTCRRASIADSISETVVKERKSGKGKKEEDEEKNRRITSDLENAAHVAASIT